MSRVAIAAACFVVAATPALAQSKAAIQKLEDQWAAAFDKGDAKAVAAMYAPDAYVLPQGAAMVHGQQAIEALWAEEMKYISDPKCTTAAVKPLGPRAAWEYGTCTFKNKVHPPENGALKYAVVWQKTAGGWKLFQDMWNLDK